ncbi:hypothetical protein KIN20_026229 [Parelaphostrongylus tenuis]|uniref:Uncharacterized protein n=1 Tax=Parelaphostrongylus tenuis TaxID=148309 RepID=A0AAD5N0B1_PARTN|nr:hypothetical protein KIN20_026229 [Parelaphostrongylus tenuis]
MNTKILDQQSTLAYRYNHPPPDGDKIKSENVRDKSNDEKVATKKSGLSLKESEYAIDKPKSWETTTQTKKKVIRLNPAPKVAAKQRGLKRKRRSKKYPKH